MKKTDDRTMAQPRPGSVRDSWGDPCSAATAGSYPLSARCAECLADIRCVSGDAAWAHTLTRQIVCSLTVHHIRKQLPKRGGNQFYKAAPPKACATLCGAEPTSDDLAWGQRNHKWTRENACPACVAAIGIG